MLHMEYPDLKQAAVAQFVLDCFAVTKTKEQLLEVIRNWVYPKVVDAICFPFSSTTPTEIELHKLNKMLTYIRFEKEIKSIEEYDALIKMLIYNFIDSSDLTLSSEDYNFAN